MSLEYRIAVFTGFILVVMVGVAIRVFAAPAVLQHDAWIWLSGGIAAINGLSLVSRFNSREK